MYYRRKCRIASVIAILLAFVLPLSAMAAPADYDAARPAMLTADHLYGESAVVIDSESGEVLFSKDSRVRMYPASTTKIMTLLLAIETGWDFGMTVTVPSEAGDIPIDSSTVPVYEGEVTTFGDLLYGMMLKSGNDAANAIAVIVSGSLSSFVEKMNNRAAELGCVGTHFVNPHGYHDENHYSTAYDLALITQEALKHDVIRQIISTQSYIMNAAPREPFQINTSNSMILPNSSYYYEDAIGVKTGTHSKAGMCFVGAAEKDGLTLITVTLNCESDGAKWTDTARLLDYGFTRYTAYTLEQMFELSSSRLLTTRVSNAAQDDPMGGVLEMKLTQVSDASYVRMIQTGSEEARDRAITDFAQRAQITLMDNLTAPITEGEFVGSFSYTAQDGQVLTASLIAGRSIAAQPEKTTIYDVFPFLTAFQNPLVLMLIAVLILLVVVLVIYSNAKRRRRERRRRELYEQRRREYLRQQRANTNDARRSNPNVQRTQRPRPSNTRPVKRRSSDDDIFGGF